jgi:hypothetical protein
VSDLGVDLGVVAIPDSRKDNMSYLLIPLVQRSSPELAPLRETLRAWVSVVASSADACLVLDGDGRVAGLSASAAALVNEDAANIVGRRLVGDVFVIVDFSSAAEPIGDHAIVPPTQALHSDVLSRGLVRLRRADDITMTIDAIAAPLHAHDGSLIGSLTFFAPLGSS